MKNIKVKMGVDKLELTGHLIPEFQHFLNYLSEPKYFDRISDVERNKKAENLKQKYSCDRVFTSRNYSQVAQFEDFVVMSGNSFQKTDKIVVNPNKAPEVMQDVLSWMPAPRVSRIDINFDCEVDIRKIFRTIKRKRVRSFRVFYKSGYPETFYIGGTGSGRMLRIYDKYRESKDTRYLGITRIEFQIRYEFLRKVMKTDLATVISQLGFFLDYQITEDSEDGGQLSSQIIADKSFSDIYDAQIEEVVKCWY